MSKNTGIYFIKNSNNLKNEIYVLYSDNNFDDNFADSIKYANENTYNSVVIKGYEILSSNYKYLLFELSLDFNKLMKRDFNYYIYKIRYIFLFVRLIVIS